MTGEDQSVGNGGIRGERELDDCVFTLGTSDAAAQPQGKQHSQDLERYQDKTHVTMTMDGLTSMMPNTIDSAPTV